MRKYTSAKYRLLPYWWMGALLLLAAFLNGANTVLAQSEDPRPAPALVYGAQGISIELYDDAIRQGRAGLVRLSGLEIETAAATLFDRRFTFFPSPNEADEAYYGFIAVPFEQATRTYDMTLNITLADGTPLAILVPVEVRSGEFLRQDVTLREDQLDLIDPQVEAEEFALLDALTLPVTPGWFGAAGFQPASDAELTSPYGAVRVFNEQLETRHTGWDYTGETGDMLRAMSDGRVVFAGTLPIRGGYVLIDHGYGVYSGYAHLSVKRVVIGQVVRRGQVIGLAGSTGRSSSAHLHIEMRVMDTWVDPVDFIEMWTPSVRSLES